MKTWTGKLTKKFHRDFQGTKLYSFQIEGVDRWFRTGKEEIAPTVGTMITFTEKNSQVMMDSVADAGPAPDVEPTTGTKSGPSQPTEPVASTAPTVGQRMAWENARRDATRIVVAALQTDVLPWNKNTAKAKRLDLLVGYVNQVAKDLLNQQNEE